MKSTQLTIINNRFFNFELIYQQSFNFRHGKKIAPKLIFFYKKLESSRTFDTPIVFHFH